MCRARGGAATQSVEQLAARLAVEPTGVADEPAVISHCGLVFQVQDGEKIIGLRKSKLGVAETRHGRESGRFLAAERADRFIAIQKRFQVVEMDGHVVRVRRIVDEGEPLDDVALDGVGDVVHRVGAVGEAEVDDGGDVGGEVGAGPRIAPEKVGSVEVVVCPKRGESGQERRELSVKGREDFEGAFGAGVDGFVRRERGAYGEIAFHCGSRIAGSEDGEAGDEWARLAGRSIEILRGKMEPRQGSAG